MSDCVIIGIGNLIKSDDGFGVHVVRRLQGRVPDGVELVEGSVYCADLLPFLDGCRRLIFIDGIDAEDEPGAIFRFSPDDVRPSTRGVSLSIHDFGVYELLMAAKLLDQCPEDISIFAVQVKNIEIGDRLSPEVSAAVEKVCRMVLEEVVGAAEPDSRSGDGGGL
jgi:hydrogenase maturation protease